MRNKAEDIARIVSIAEERGLTHFQASCVDSVGRLVGKRYHVKNLSKVMTDGMAFIEAAAAAIDPQGGVIETNPYFDPTAGFADAVVVLDATSARDVPFVADGQGLLLIGQFIDHMAAVCPRALLDAELERLAGLGFSAYGGFELECAPLAETTASIQTKAPDAVSPRPGYERFYSFVDEAYEEDLLADLLNTASAMGVDIDSIHGEFINMIEVGLRPQEGIRIAENAAIYKSLAKVVGRKHDTLMSFMARRDNSGQGCGAHINVSLRSTDGGNGVFHDAASADGLSETFRFFMGGLVRYMPDLFLLVAPNLNSYRRFVPDLFTPLNNSWGINNKTVAFRAINVTPAATRVEVRVAGADLNPYLGLLAVITAGRLGIEEKIEPPAAVEGDGWSLDDVPNPFPTSFSEAIDKFSGSAVARAQLGDRFVDEFSADRRWQLDQFNRTVTDWELRMFVDS